MNLDSVTSDRIFLHRLQDKYMILASLRNLPIVRRDFDVLVKTLLRIQINAELNDTILSVEECYSWLLNNLLIIENLEAIDMFPLFGNERI